MYVLNIFSLKVETSFRENAFLKNVIKNAWIAQMFLCFRVMFGESWKKFQITLSMVPKGLKSKFGNEINVSWVKLAQVTYLDGKFIIMSNDSYRRSLALYVDYSRVEGLRIYWELTNVHYELLRVTTIPSICSTQLLVVNNSSTFDLSKEVKIKCGGAPFRSRVIIWKVVETY